MSTVRRRVERALLVVAVVVAVVAPLLDTADVALPGRRWLALAFVLLVPGVPVAIRLRMPDGLAAVALGLGTSLSALLVVSTLFLVSGLWNPLALLWLLALLCLLLSPAAWSATRGAPVEPVEPHDLGEPVVPVPVVPPERQRVDAGTWIATAAPRTLPLAALLCGLELWVYAAARLHLDAVGPAGLIGVTGIPYLLGLAVVAAVAGWALREDDPDPVVMTGVAVTLIVMLFAFTNVGDSAPGFPTAWTHVGFIDYISRHGHPAKGFDARFSWPGFFAAGAALVHLAGLPNAIPLIRWAPVVYELLALPALLVIGRVVSGSRRAAWLGVLVYSCFNWFDQDYLSPQATVLLLYLAVIATLLTTAVPAPVDDPRLIVRIYRQARTLPLRPDWLTRGRAVGVEAVLVLLCAASVVSHQLTPVTLIGLLLAFALTGATRYRQLWLIAALVFLAWFSFGAEDFWRGHLGTVFGDFGKLGSTLGSSVGQRLQGDPVHGRMQQLRLLWSAGSIALAAVGLWLRRHEPRVATVAALAFAPFALLAMQSYGGEVALRCFVYAQPAVAPLVAVTVLWAVGWLVRRTGRGARLQVALLAALLFVGATVLTAVRGANIGFERVTSSQVAVARKLLEAMPSGSTIGVLADTGPLGFERLTDYRAVSLAPDVCGPDIVRCVRRKQPAYVFVTATMDQLGQLQFGEPANWTQQVVADLQHQHLYRRLASSSDAIVLGRTERRL